MPFYCFKNHCNIPCYFLNSSCSGKATRISPENSEYSWSALAVDGHNVLAVSSSPIDPPQIKYGHQVSLKDQTCTWVWDEVNNNPLMAANNKVRWCTI
jgi:acylaminoacyl-peptidase